MIFLTEAAVQALHQRLIGDFGGSSAAVRDQNSLASALARPQNYLAYQDENASLTTLAALYGHGLARNHAFHDGNKRTAWVVMGAFLDRNGLRLVVDDGEMVALIVQVAKGDIDEVELAEWLAAHVEPRT